MAARVWTTVTVVGVMIGACASEQRGGQTTAAPAPLAPQAPEPAAPLSAEPAQQDEPGELQSSQLPPPAPAEPFAGAPFPPDNITPPHPRSALPGDGVWTPMGSETLGERTAADPRVMMRTVIHPHPISRFMSVTLVAIDLRHASLNLAAGTIEPQTKRVPAEERSGLVPAEHQNDLLAVFNGGWEARHGQWGMAVGELEFLAPREQGCTIAIYRDGAVRIGTWPALAASRDDMKALRQTPPCVVENAEVHPHISSGQLRAWGGQDPARKTRRRSAIGIDASGRTLFYAFGEEVEVDLLAEGMRLGRAVNAAQLDINYNWTRFLVFGRPSADAALQITSTLVPKMVHTRRGYVEQAAQKDFFYVMRR